MLVVQLVGPLGEVVTIERDPKSIRCRMFDLATAPAVAYLFESWSSQLIRTRGLSRPSRRFPICSILVRPAAEMR
jgi:hypothetical protein